MTNPHIPKISAFSFRRRQRRNSPVKIKSQMIAVAAAPEELVDFVVA
jgi:hypothetical protein